MSDNAQLYGVKLVGKVGQVEVTVFAIDGEKAVKSFETALEAGQKLRAAQEKLDQIRGR